MEIAEGAHAKGEEFPLGEIDSTFELPMALDIAAYVIAHFNGQPLHGGDIRKPHRILQSAINHAAAVLSEASSKSPIADSDDASAQGAPDPSEPFALMLGRTTSGHSQLQARLGVAVQLIPLAEGGRGLAETVRAATAKIAHAGQPSLICALLSLDHLADPSTLLTALSRTAGDAGFNDVPWLIATIDPDYALSGLARRPESPVRLDDSASGHSLIARDPAWWEEAFTESGFIVLEQRPVHLNLLPAALASALMQKHSTRFFNKPDLMPPRQGPFYLWLLAPRAGERAQSLANARFQTLEGLEADTRNARSGAVIEVVGNLGNRIYRVLAGTVGYQSESLGLSMPFEPTQMFGQLEVSGNYVASRVLGKIQVEKDAIIESVSSRQFREKLQASNDVGYDAFLSMMGHMDDIRFEALISPKRLDSKRISKVFQAGKKALVADWVRNYAGALLHFSGRSMKKSAVGYKSRFVVRMGTMEYLKLAYDLEPDKTHPSYQVIQHFVQSGVIDCFSPSLIKQNDKHHASSFQNDISEAQTESLDQFHPLHIGWYAAQHLMASTDGNLDEAARFDGTYQLARSIAAMLGSDTDKDVFHQEWNQGNKSEERNKSQDGKSIKSKRPRHKTELKNWVISTWSTLGGRPTESDSVSHFLELLYEDLNFVSSDHYQTLHGLSSLVVVRDIWALLACAMDAPEMWLWETIATPPQAYFAQPEQRSRISAYFQECIEYLATEAGLQAG